MPEAYSTGLIRSVCGRSRTVSLQNVSSLVKSIWLDLCVKAPLLDECRGPFAFAAITRKYPGGVMGNPRYANGNARRKLALSVRSRGDECGICHGRRGPIHYDEPSDHLHPLSFVLDEKHPVKYWNLYGYESPTACALDPDNVQAAHWICNSEKGDKDGFHIGNDGTQAQKVVTSRLR